MTDLALAIEEGAGYRWEQPCWVVVETIRLPWVVLTMVRGGMLYLTRSISKEQTIASSRVTWDQRASSLALASIGRVVLKHLE